MVVFFEEVHRKCGIMKGDEMLPKEGWRENRVPFLAYKERGGINSLWRIGGSKKG
jgi:hypothetical protein